MILRSLVWFVAVAAVWSPLCAGDVEVRLKSGETAFGALISQDDNQVAINRRLWTKNGVLEGTVDYPRNRVLDVVEVPSLTALYQAKAGAAGSEYEVHYALAHWCMDRGLIDQAFVHAKGLYDRDPKDVVTLKLMDEIGYMLVDGAWVTQAENAAKHGLVAYDSTYLTPAEVDLRKTVARTSITQDATESKVKTCENRIETEAKRVKDANARLAKVQADEAKKAAEKKKAEDDYRRQAAKRKIAVTPAEEKKAVEPPSVTNAKASVEHATKSEQQAREDLKKAQEDVVKAAAEHEAAAKALKEFQVKAGTAKADAGKPEAEKKAENKAEKPRAASGEAAKSAAK
ncbi:MAG: hypothetical protein H0V44_14775 [Planctomycetes bacterium]|nr:hypothetical protein [Planctomycetota bacterium]